MNAFIGSKLIELRESKGLSRLKVAEEIGYDQSNLSKIEKGTYQASPELLKRLADYHGVSVGYLFGEVEVSSNYTLSQEWVEFILEMKEEGITTNQLREVVSIAKRAKSIFQ
ncbi:helix-turn-helix domain-containing protein [Priestia megaterium]|uniref:helix-turn-helix domain-containing protein n=1 Tax=Priestia megaterium TaxID=1404 RepID=UPI003CC50894